MLTFLGGVGTVTGSRFLVETGAGARVLVDCGLYQGRKQLRERNWNPFPVPADSIDAVVLTHAHVDHCGYLPALAKAGFTGPVHTSPGTGHLLDIVLPDSGHLHEEEARYANRKGFSKHHPALPLYTEDDARRALELVDPLPFGTPREIAPGLQVTLAPAGHILGSAIAHLDLDTNPGRDDVGTTGGRSVSRRIVFSGDLGRAAHPLLLPPTPLGRADIVLVESTYGNRVHDDAHALEQLAGAISRTARRGGTVVIPAFAVDRTEVLLHHLRLLREQGAIPELPIFVDSPMALRALGVYRRAIADSNPDIRPDLVALDGDVLAPGGLREVRDVEGSMELDANRFPSIIVSASGMATGGRVLHHLAHRLPDSRNCVILVGFQAEQTRGRLLAEGARQLKLLGRYVPVQAEVVDLPSFSVHADRNELLAWLRTADGVPEVAYVVHGEPDASASLADDMTAELGWNAVVPTFGERVRLD